MNALVLIGLCLAAFGVGRKLADLMERETNKDSLHHRIKELEDDAAHWRQDRNYWQTQAFKYQDELIRQRDAGRRIVLAVTVKGKSPAHHERVMLEHRIEWPVLWDAIDAYIEASSRELPQPRKDICL